MPASLRPRIRVLIDGGCALCNGFARFVEARDRSGLFEFLPGDNPSTVILIENGRMYTRSSAALRILGRLGFPWSWVARLGSLLPLVVRDAIYDQIARRRRAISCRLP